jgi:hypothetical protein
VLQYVKECEKQGVKMGNKTWKPTTGGILSIVAGVPAITGGITLALLATGVASLGAILWMIPGMDKAPVLPGILGGVGIFLGLIAILPIALGAVAIVGGVYALKRRKWGLALAGSICSVITVALLGIPALIFVILGKDEFEASPVTAVSQGTEQ